ncbi:MurR/RpiR family transcriptional regulator [Brevibacillus brevis]|uniref:MurR/RpiR family transcriptional regulator n=1 Tax=Brevibacillus brevis TaxID=1393 RepID=A0ABY9TBJ6_BREBE|nr:MurR/RpiR family transcriptional regulator [Brevibacillus brevis]WNC17499.1 MurR/RpiR family transcriptional regulator [Brevibacillus brevis]
MHTPVAICELSIKISSYVKSLTKSEKKVALYVLDHFEDILNMSVTDLAEQANVGETTVLRFCRKLDFKGYQEFKLALAKSTVHPLANLHSQLTESDPFQVMLQKVNASNVQAIQETTGMVDAKELNRAVELILNSRKIHVYGAGVSGVTALDAKSRFMRIGLSVDAFLDAHQQAMAATTLSENDLAIGFSVSGSTKDTVDALRIAKENGAKIIAGTHFARSPVTKMADVVLLHGGRETPLQGGSLAAKIAQLHAVDLLYTGVALRMKEKALYFREKAAKAVADKAY